jgi:hypothetical protein
VRRSAVLILLTDDDDRAGGPDVLLTERAVAVQLAV